jgi:hypothetical protein
VAVACAGVLTLEASIWLAVVLPVMLLITLIFGEMALWAYAPEKLSLFVLSAAADFFLYGIVRWFGG